MKNRTHRAVGAAVALAAVQPQTLLGCGIAIAAGAMGAAVSDIDLLWKASARAVLRRTLEWALVLAALLAVDHLARTGVTASLVTLRGPGWAVGVLMLAGLLMLGFFSEHRSFTHSLLGMALFGAAVHLVVPGHALGFIAGFGSHLALDLFNRAPLKLLFPFRTGFTLHLFAADGLVDKALFAAGWLTAALFVLHTVLLQYL